MELHGEGGEGMEENRREGWDREGQREGEQERERESVRAIEMERKREREGRRAREGERKHGLGFDVSQVLWAICQRAICLRNGVFNYGRPHT